MAKKTKIELPKYEDWKAPWEVDAEGNDIPAEEQQFDAAKARKLIFDRTVEMVAPSRSSSHGMPPVAMASVVRAS